MTGRMFEKSSQEAYRYRFILEINLLESKNQFNLHIRGWIWNAEPRGKQRVLFY